MTAASIKKGKKKKNIGDFEDEVLIFSDLLLSLENCKN